MPPSVFRYIANPATQPLKSDLLKIANICPVERQSGFGDIPKGEPMNNGSLFGSDFIKSTSSTSSIRSKKILKRGY